MRTPSSRPVSHAMLKKAAEVTDGYGTNDFEMWISQQGIMYLTVYNVTYNIDRDGGCVVRRASDGEPVSWRDGL